jgi:hypothetical protein
MIQFSQDTISLVFLLEGIVLRAEWALSPYATQSIVRNGSYLLEDLQSSFLAHSH